jgi:hypothetical protein
MSDEENLQKLNSEYNRVYEEYEKAVADKKKYSHLKDKLTELNNEIEKLETKIQDKKSAETGKPKISTDSSTQTNKMTDAISTVLKIMNETFDGEPKNVGTLPTILKQIDLIAKTVKAEDTALAISAIKTRFIKRADTAVGNDVSTYDEIKNALIQHCSGEKSWDICTQLQGVSSHDKDKYLNELTEIAERLRYAFLNEGTAELTAEKHVINEVIKNVKSNFAGNTEMKSAMNNNFSSITEVFTRFRSVQNEQKTQILHINYKRNGRNSVRGNFRGNSRGNYSRGNYNNNFRNDRNYGQTNYNNNYQNNNGRFQSRGRARGNNRQNNNNGNRYNGNNIRIVTEQGNEQGPQNALGD